MKGKLFKKALAAATSFLMLSGGVSVQPFAGICKGIAITASAADYIIQAEDQTISDATTWENCTVNIIGDGTITYNKRIIISGSVTIDLGVGTTLVAPSGIEVDEGNELTIEGDGALNASVSDNFYSAIGRGFHGNTPGTSGTININGGNITATGGKFAAGIGGGDTGAGGTININGGTIVATGGYLAAGIGGGVYGAGGVINISGGQVTAISDDRASGIGPGYKGGISGTVTLGWTNEDDFIYATNYDNVETLTLDDEFYYVDNGEHIVATTANIGGKTLYPLIDKNTLEYANIAGIEPFYRYTGNDIDITYTVTDLEGNLMEYGKDYTAEFSPSTIKEKGDYTLTITAAGTNYTGSKSITFSVVDSITVTASTTEMNEKYGVPYRVSADATVDSRINIVGDILLILDEGKTLTASKGIELSKNNKLTIEGNGSLTANGDGNNAGIGALEVGTLIINSGNITATGGDEGSAGIGGSKTNYQGNTDGGFITINGGSVNATGSPYAAAIGGSLMGVCGSITINGGKVTANGGIHVVAGNNVNGYGIGPGYKGTKSGTITLGWTDEDDFIYFSSIADVENIRFAAGKNFFYAENNANVVATTDNIEGKTIHPYLEKIDFENVTISGIQPYYPYTGNDIDIEFDVIDAGGNKLTINDDYTAEFSQTPINGKGDYTLTVTAASGGNFTGSKSLTFHVVDYISVTAETTTMTSDFGLSYRVDDNVTVDERITISGDVTLILDEGKTLTTSKGIELSAGNKLTIEGKGILKATGEDAKSGIGAKKVGTLVINSNVIAIGGNNAAGIGGSSNNTSGGTIIINSGEIVAKGGLGAAGIGGGLVGPCGTVSINGGKIVAEGGSYGDLISSGIGPGDYGQKSGSVTLGWTTEDDRILASNYNDVETLQFAEGKRFYIKNDENKIIATAENINGKALIPLNGYFVDSASASVTVGDDSHKDIFNEKEYIIYKPGETVILNITPDDGYAVKSVKANNIEILPENGVYSFEMPAEDVTVTAVFGHTVEIDNNITNGTVSADLPVAENNEAVTLTVTPAAGYAVKSVKVGNTEIEPVNGVYSFTMLDNDVTVTAEFEAIDYNINITAPTNGSITAKIGDTSASTAHYSDTVTLDVTPDTGYSVKSVKVGNTVIEPVEGVYSFTMPAEDVTVTAEFKRVFSDNIGENLAGYSISLQGDIGVNFYMELDESIVNSDTAYMQFTLPNGTAPKVMVKDVKSNAQTVGGKTYYVFKCNVSAKEMASEIKAQIIDGDKAGTEYTYSVKDYADYLLAHTAEKADYAAAAPLVKAMLNYGANSQTYFGVEGTLANAGLDDADKVLGDVTIEHSAPVISALPEGVTFEGASLSLKSETTLSLFFKNTSGDPVTFKYGSDEITAVDNNGYLQVTITGIKAKQLSSDFTITVGDSGSVTYSPMNYCKTVLEGEYPDNLKNVVKALYKYSQEADSYFTT